MKLMNLDIQRFATEKITREQVASYLDTTPSNPSLWGLIGVGVTTYGLAFNPQVTTEKWIIDRNATSNVDSYQIQGDVSQKCYKGDAIFEYINGLRRSAEIGSGAISRVLDVDMYDEVSDGVFNATQYDCTIAITNYMAEDAVIEYTIYYNGDAKLGTVSLDGEGVPTFTETPASL